MNENKDFEDLLLTREELANRLNELCLVDNFPVALKAVLEELRMKGLETGMDPEDGITVSFTTGTEVTNEQWAKLTGEKEDV